MIKERWNMVVYEVEGQEGDLVLQAALIEDEECDYHEEARQFIKVNFAHP